MHIPTLVSAMEEATGHRFTDVPTLLQALTHTSYANEHPLLVTTSSASMRGVSRGSHRHLY